MSAFFIVSFPVLSQRGHYRIASFWCLIILTWLRLCCGVRYEVKGLDNIGQSPTVYLSNHQSSWETLLFYRLIYPLSPILKKELMNIPFWGWALRLTKPIAIDRSKPREAGKSLLTQGVQRLKEGSSVIVFPEGTRSKPGTLKRFSRSGATLATSATVPIVPIAHNAGYCWPPRSFIKYPGKITVEFGPAIDVSEQSVNELTEQAEAWVRAHVVLRQ
ncbi:MAG: 1-acyl-sn-glycerol-3-phosphate acyltransferase [Pseudomonadales bacterium]|nr:1-acyl-sn-glycerol-3-phosphate acyltransferase [Pseudomonadales bacterium]